MSRKQDITAPEFRGRLEFLASRWSQAEIARKTATQRNNVSRYMHGGKMPVEFAAALVRNLGVNPAWLLTGEGAPLLSDVNAQTGRMAGELLELVEAMNAVANAQLGSLTGQHHLRMLRELNDALARFEKLRAGLNKRTGPIFSQVLDDYWKALELWQLDKADDLRRAAQQVARLCDDEKLQERFERCISFHAFLRRDEDESTRYQARVFLRRLVDARLEEAGMRDAYNLANTLQSNARLDDAIAVCDAALALAGRRGADWAATRLVQAMSGYALTERGDLAEGTKRIIGAGRQEQPAWRAVQQSMLIRCLLLAADIDFARALQMRGEGPAHAQGMLVYAMCLEDTPTFLEACKHFLPDDAAEFTQFTRAVREALTGNRAAATQFLKTYPSSGRKPLNEQFDQAVFGTALARWCGGRDAQARHAEASRLLDNVGERCYSILARAMHYKNVLALAGAKDPARKAAAVFFAEHVKRGYGCFAALV